MVQSDMFEEFGSHLWDEKIDPLFQNYRQFSAGFLLGLVREHLSGFYNVPVTPPGTFDESQVIQIDWGSVAAQQFYR